MIILWIAFIVVFLIAEMITVGLTTIWFAGGALVALIATALGAPIWLQCALFLVVSVLLLLFTRPFVKKYINPHKEKTNYEGAIGKTVRITERVDNIAETGTAVLNGQEWCARSADDGVTLEADTTAEVVAVSGVKLIVKEQ